MKSILFRSLLAILFIAILSLITLYFRYVRESTLIHELPIRSPPSSKLSSNESWLELFDGVSLKDWKVKIKGEPLGQDLRKTFRVHDKSISINYENYSNWEDSFGHLFYHLSYSHYILKLEYRFIGEQLAEAKDLEWAWRNSGVMIHAQSPENMGIEQKFPVSIEVQLLGAKAHEHRSTGNLCTPGTHVSFGSRLITQHCINSLSSSLPGDQWVALEIEVRGNEIIRHFVNGQFVLQYSSPVLDAWSLDARKISYSNDGKINLSDGYIALQSESHPVQFKNIKVLPLL